jgi:hypothetical protein
VEIRHRLSGHLRIVICPTRLVVGKLPRMKKPVRKPYLVYRTLETSLRGVVAHQQTGWWVGVGDQYK